MQASWPILSRWQSLSRSTGGRLCRFEVNVLGAYLVARAFLKVSAPKNALLLHLSTGAVHLPPTPHYSSYQASKLAGTKVIDGVAAENPGIRVTNVHPGVVEPLMGNKALDAGAPYPIDESEGRSFTVLSNTTGRKGLC